jgi:hypothetical protein
VRDALSLVYCLSQLTGMAVLSLRWRGIAEYEENRWINWPSPLCRTMIESRSIGFGAFSKWLNGLWETLKGK